MFDTSIMKQVRLAENKTQEDVAKLLNVGKSSYAMWESNNNVIPIKRLCDFCKIFNVSLDYIFGFNTKSNYALNNNEIDLKLAGERLKNFRKENNITQEELAKNLNTTKSVISGYEHGRYLIATLFLYDICKKYKISADYLLGRSNNSILSTN